MIGFDYHQLRIALLIWGIMTLVTPFILFLVFYKPTWKDVLYYVPAIILCEFTGWMGISAIGSFFNY